MRILYTRDQSKRTGTPIKFNVNEQYEVNKAYELMRTILSVTLLICLKYYNQQVTCLYNFSVSFFTCLLPIRSYRNKIDNATAICFKPLMAPMKSSFCRSKKT